MNCDNKGTEPADLVAESPSRVAGEWVKELFAPIYDFDAVVAAGRDGYKNEERKPLRVPILDAESIREVFERVHKRVVEAENKRLQDIKEEEERQQLEKLDPRQSSIWNTEELDTLRKVYKSAKGEINKLEVALHEQTEHSKILELTVEKQRKEIEDLRSGLTEATKANHRLSIHRDSLLKDKAILEIKLSALTDMWHDIEHEKNLRFACVSHLTVRLIVVQTGGSKPVKQTLFGFVWSDDLMYDGQAPGWELVTRKTT